MFVFFVDKYVFILHKYIGDMKMEAYREIIDGSKLVDIINIPKEFINSKIEIIIMPVFQRNRNDILKKTAGLLSSKKIDPLKWQEEIRAEWDDK